MLTVFSLRILPTTGFSINMPNLAVLCHSEIGGFPGRRVRMETASGFSFGIIYDNMFNYDHMEVAFATHL